MKTGEATTGPALEIIIKTTDACNASCLYCSAKTHQSGHRRLSLAHARLLCEQAQALLETGRYSRIRLLWHGGEPLLLGKDFFSELRSFGSVPGFEHRIQTNLTLLDAEWIEILEPLIGRNGLGTSLDPFDDIRRLPGGHYADQWLRALAHCDRAGWCIGCVYVLHRRGLERAEPLYWFFRNLRDEGTISLRVNPLLPVGHADRPACRDLLLQPGEYGAFLIDLTKHWISDGCRLTIQPIANFVAMAGGDYRRVSCDLAGRKGCMDAHFGIDPDGRIYNCGRAVDASGLCFGHLSDTTLTACLGHPDRRHLLEREDVLRAAACGACGYWRYCHGGCAYDSHTLSEQANQPTLLCADYRRFYDWLLSGDIRAEAPRADAEGSTAEGLEPVMGDGHVFPSCGGHRRVAWNADETSRAMVESLARRGIPVALEALRRWPPDALRQLASFFLHSEALEAPIEPFFSVFSSLAPGASPLSLARLYGEPEMRFARCGSHMDLPCATCSGYVTCRGFWECKAEYCNEWRAIMGEFSAAIALLTGKGIQSNVA